MMIEIGKLIRQMRKKKGMTQLELGAGIISKAVLSRIENGLTEPDIFQLNALLQRLGKSLQPFEIIVSSKEYEQLKKEAESAQIHTIVIEEAVFFKDIREAKGLSQEKFSSDICARETISKIEHGRNPHMKNFQTLMNRLGEPFEKYYGYVSSQEWEVYELVERYQGKKGKCPEEARYLLQQILEKLDASVPVNRQFLESSKLMEERRRNIITMGEELVGLEQCLRYTMPEYDRMIYRIPYRQEVIILEEIVKCLKRIKKSDVAVELAESVQVKISKKLMLR